MSASKKPENTQVSHEADSEKANPNEKQPAEAKTGRGELQEQLQGLQEQLQTALQERDANYERWLRSQADLENYRKRSRKEMEEGHRYQLAAFVRDLLPALDNLQRAIQASAESQNVEELVQGVRMVAQQFEDILGQHAVVPIEAIGEPFDPNLHEALQQMPSADHPPMTVIQELERGYKLHDRVVRPSKVIVSSVPPETQETTSTEPERDAKPAD